MQNYFEPQQKEPYMTEIQKKNPLPQRRAYQRLTVKFISFDKAESQNILDMLIREENPYKMKEIIQKNAIKS